MSEFASASFTAGQLNAMVKKLKELAGDGGPTLLLQGKLKIEVVKNNTLNTLGTITTPDTTEKFVARDKFHKESEKVKFAFISDKFQSWFFDGKIEEPLGEQSLRYGDLIKRSVDGPIIKELGGEAKFETTLSALYDLLAKQRNGEEGVLLTNRYPNIFYVKDISGTLRAVGVHWRGVGWRVGARSVGHPGGWFAGDRVFSAILEPLVP